MYHLLANFVRVRDKRGKSSTSTAHTQYKELIKHKFDVFLDVGL